MGSPIERTEAKLELKEARRVVLPIDSFRMVELRVQNIKNLIHALLCACAKQRL